MNSSPVSSEKKQTALSVLRMAFPFTVPVLFGYLAIGIPFGLTLTKAGYPWWLAPIMSLTMYAGAGQYIAIGLFTAGVPLSGMLITMLMVNIRHIVYGVSLIEKFKTAGKWKPYLIFALTDETYALLTGVKPPEISNQGDFYGAIALLDQSYWVIGSTVGALAGTLIPFSFEGIDFALTSLFTVLLIDQLRRTRDILPVAIGFVCAVLALIFAGPENMLIIALVSALAVLALFRGRSK
ncbi:AzlC family ABC transporter permease [Brucepastera parasyntrophica]|uniref:AzlC family ABC transporter permease n=1 Tax=Brucepastera parasyntrophica TaxID=2880008 RepID=UPI00210C7A8E|nr:AzlC family ABC transporter permease [Brucepastera parasyntrophica]ULQ60620.1 AzlC family ABC transporter permease [Brucepastera parasyntrophica]